MKSLKFRMGLTFWIGMAFLFKPLNSFAVDAATQAQGAQVPCATCGGSAATAPIPMSVVAGAEDFLTQLNSPFNCDKTSDPKNCTLIKWLRMNHESYAPNCKGFFLDEQGHLGTYSQMISSLIAGDLKEFKEDSVFNKDNPDFDRLCPAFKTFTPVQKIAFHSWNFELLAFPESTCNINIRPNTAAPTTKAVCLYQLEDLPKIRQWRSGQFSVKHCAVSAQEILTLKGCTGCAFDEYKRKTMKDGTPFGVFDNTGKKISGAYWASYNPLPAAQEKCFEKYMDAKGNPIIKGKKALFLSMCKNSNNEWTPRYKFFKRIQKFPLCETELAQKELVKLNDWEKNHVQK